MDTPEFTALLRRHAALIHKIACAYCRDVADREAVQLWRSRTRYDDRYRHTTWIATGTTLVIDGGLTSA